MSEEDIDSFIAVTAADRRSALWFLSHARDLNDAVSNFFDRGISSIPDDFNPDGEEEDESTTSSISSSESSGEEMADSGIASLFETPSPETEETAKQIDSSESPTISAQQCTVDDSITSQKFISHKNKSKCAGSQRSYILSIPEVVEVREKEKIITIPQNILPIRKPNCDTQTFILWKDGFSFANNFTKACGEDYEKIMKMIQIGQLPKNINAGPDVQLVNKSNEEFHI